MPLPPLPLPLPIFDSIISSHATHQSEGVHINRFHIPSFSQIFETEESKCMVQYVWSNKPSETGWFLLHHLNEEALRFLKVDGLEL